MTRQFNAINQMKSDISSILFFLSFKWNINKLNITLNISILFHQKILGKKSSSEGIDDSNNSSESSIPSKSSVEYVDENKIIHKDSNGVVLQDGDSVVLIKDLDVKGAGFTAKRGAAVHNIKLVWDNAEHIEGRVENQHIVILTQYVKKTK